MAPLISNYIVGPTKGDLGQKAIFSRKNPLLKNRARRSLAKKRTPNMLFQDIFLLPIPNMEEDDSGKFNYT